VERSTFPPSPSDSAPVVPLLTAICLFVLIKRAPRDHGARTHISNAFLFSTFASLLLCLFMESDRRILVLHCLISLAR
jgi:hypothetical protein